MSSPQTTSAQLAGHGWRLVQEALDAAGSERELIIHWFVTPTETSVHRDQHWDDNDRVAKFMGLVVPTLAEQLRASMLAVAVPWDVTASGAVLTLVTLVTGQSAAVQARALTRTALADAAPYWQLSREPVTPPARLTEIAAGLEL